MRKINNIEIHIKSQHDFNLFNVAHNAPGRPSFPDGLEQFDFGLTIVVMHGNTFRLIKKEAKTRGEDTPNDSSDFDIEVSNSTSTLNGVATWPMHTHTPQGIVSRLRIRSRVWPLPKASMAHSGIHAPKYICSHWYRLKTNLVLRPFCRPCCLQKHHQRRCQMFNPSRRVVKQRIKNQQLEKSVLRR